MAVKSVVTTYECDLCAAETTVWVDDFDDLERFETEWYGSLAFDLCPTCRRLPDGIAMIESDRRTLVELKKRAGF